MPTEHESTPYNISHGDPTPSAPPVMSPSLSDEDVQRLVDVLDIFEAAEKLPPRKRRGIYADVDQPFDDALTVRRLGTGRPRGRPELPLPHGLDARQHEERRRALGLSKRVYAVSIGVPHATYDGKTRHLSACSRTGARMTVQARERLKAFMANCAPNLAAALTTRNLVHARRYADRRARGVCVQCETPASGTHLCVGCRSARLLARRALREGERVEVPAVGTATEGGAVVIDAGARPPAREDAEIPNVRQSAREDVRAGGIAALERRIELTRAELSGLEQALELLRGRAGAAPAPPGSVPTRLHCNQCRQLRTVEEMTRNGGVRANCNACSVKKRTLCTQCRTIRTPAEMSHNGKTRTMCTPCIERRRNLYDPKHTIEMRIKKIREASARIDAAPPDEGPRVLFSPRSGNKKLGPMPMSMSERGTCPSSCSFYEVGCYASYAWNGSMWRKVARVGMRWPVFLETVRKLPPSQLWRHNEAGDLVGDVGGGIDLSRLSQLVEANQGRSGFTYTHRTTQLLGRDKRVTTAVRDANASGFTINVSADSLEQADALYDLGVAPVVVTLPTDEPGLPRRIHTPKGRSIIVCPAQTAASLTCTQCKLCAKMDRKSIVGFVAHGVASRLVSELVRSKRQGGDEAA